MNNVVPFKGTPERELREMPRSIEAEQAILGTLLIHNDSLHKVSDILKIEHFSEDLHRRVYEAAAQLIDGGKICNPMILKAYMGDPDLGGTTLMQYLARMCAEAGTPSSARDYALVVHDMAVRREVIGLADEAMQQCYNGGITLDTRAMIDGAMERLSNLRPRPNEKDDFETFEDASYRALDRASKAYQQEGQLIGLSTGLPALDDALGGLQPTDLVIVGGRPGQGKTSLAVNIAYHNGLDLWRRRQGGEKTGVVAFFSLEMSADQLAQRVICDRSAVPSWKIRRGHASEEEMVSYCDATRELQKLPIKIDAAPGTTITQLRQRARRLHKRVGIDLIIVDYLQLLSGSKREGRAQEVGEISLGLKEMAKELCVPVVALAQVNRQIDHRDDKRPTLADLRESGSIEQDADIVIFIHREEYYLARARPRHETSEAFADWEKAMHREMGAADAIIAKHRHGPLTTVTLGFESALTRFLNEPSPREPLQPTREGTIVPKKAKISFSKEETILYGLIKRLSATRGERHDDLAGSIRGARLVPVSDLLDRFAGDLSGPGSDPEVHRKEFIRAFRGLKSKDVASWAGDKASPYVYLPELVRD